MADSTFTFRVDEELKAAFAKAAQAEDRTAAQYLRVLMRDAVRHSHDKRAHDSWFREQVEQGLREADDPDIRRVPHTKVRSGWRRMRRDLEARDSGEKA